MTHFRNAHACVAGCDLGKATACFALGRLNLDGTLSVVDTHTVAHDGHPFAAFERWYRESGAHTFAAIGATGLYGRELSEPIVAGLPEDACVEAAVPAEGPHNVVRVGARGFSVWTRAADGHVSFLENERCSSGTGETMVKIAARFGLDIAEADRLAAGADESIPITARCSVFAKSEMTHFGNQGKPAAQLFRGYFESVANHTAALLLRARVPGPIWLVGGSTRITTFVQAFRAIAGDDVIVPPNALHLEALGAMRLAAEQVAQGARMKGALPLDPTGLVRRAERRFRSLEPSAGCSDNVTRMVPTAVPEGADREPAVLGFDLGSTGSKAVLTSIRTGEPVLDLYDRTRGNPVDALQRLVRALLERTTPDVRAIGLTGSGREAASTVLEACWPALTDRIVVTNEIVAHATAAVRCDPDDGESLSIVEIGGQDAKFVQVVGGRIVESDMNKACSAGTGSFLEEQAALYGIDRIEQFSELAAESTQPPDLGQMCTVFVAGSAGEALSEGFSKNDIFAGFEFSVIQNYINRVRGQRAFGERIFFQGKPATSPTLARTLASVTGREVIVPPNPGGMGAWGIGLCARTDLEGLDGEPFDLSAVLDARVVERAETRCRDPRCATYCIVDRTTVEVGSVRKKVMSGGACPKFEIASGAKNKLPREAPSAFDERAALLADLDRDGALTVGIPQVGALQEVMVWLATFLTELGLGVRVLAPDKKTLARGETRCFAADICSPAKVAHGISPGDLDVVVFPKILQQPEGDGCGGNTCPVEQGMPDMIQLALAARQSPTRIVRPPLSFGSRTSRAVFLSQLVRMARELGAPVSRVPGAARAADEAQEGYEQDLRAIGQRTLDYALEGDVPVVLLCGPLHVLHDPAINTGIPQILRENGVLALPMDCYPLPEGRPSMARMVWGDSRRALQASVAARQRGGVFPLLLSSFGCGPASFTEPSFTALMAGYPHTVLETDGHGGKAGFVTRIQAFVHTIRSFADGPSPVAPEQLARFERRPRPSIEDERDSRLVTYSMSDGFAPLMAAFYRSAGFDAVAAGPNTEESLELGRRDCSGKECLPYQLLWGAFRSRLESDESGKRQVLMQVIPAGQCKNCMFTVKDELNLERMGVADRVGVRTAGGEPELGTLSLTRLFSGVVAWDLINQLAAWYRPTDPARVDEIYTRYRDELIEHMEVPVQTGIGAVLTRSRWWKGLVRLLGQLSDEIAQLQGIVEADDRTVLLTGDIYLRMDAFGSGDLIRKLNQAGLRVLVEPCHSFMEYLMIPRRPAIEGSPLPPLKNAHIRVMQAVLRKRLTARVRERHPQIPDSAVAHSVKAATKLVDRYPAGETPLTVGSVMHHWSERLCDGAVVVAPWGCGPTHISESLLRHEREVPLLFVYNDGTPIDERRLDAFAFRVRRQPPRAEAVAGRAPGRAAAPVPLASGSATVFEAGPPRPGEPGRTAPARAPAAE